MTRPPIARRAPWTVSIALAALGPLLLASAQAQMPPAGPYLGLGVGRLHAADMQDGAINQALQGQGLAVRTTGADSHDTGWKLLLGYRFGPHLAVEGGHRRAGSAVPHQQPVERPCRVGTLAARGPPLGFRANRHRLLVGQPALPLLKAITPHEHKPEHPSFTPGAVGWPPRACWRRAP